MKIILCDTSTLLAVHWRTAFIDVPEASADIPEVEIHNGSVFTLNVDALVSPANSYGFMDGGFDYLLSQVLGWDVSARLQKMINDLPERELLVGKSLTLETNNQRWPYLISAPTMRVPMILGRHSVNVYLATLAIFNELKQNPNISSIAVTGLGTGVGKVPPEVCAHQMRQAYDTVFLGYKAPTSWHDAQARQQRLYLEPPRDLQKIG